MENTENKKKEEIKVGDYVKIIKNILVNNNKNLFATIAKVFYKINNESDFPLNTYLVRYGKEGYDLLIYEDAIEKVDLDDEIRMQMFEVAVVDENACKKMRDLCYGKDALKDIKAAIEVKDFEQVTSEMRELFTRKNHDYGNSFGRSYQKYGLISAITRMSDKWERIDSLCQKQAEVKDESIRDTLIDLANYCVMTIMKLDKKAELGQKGS